MAMVRSKVEALLKESPEPAQVWQILDYLSEKQRELDRKYDFRYSVLTSVFGRLLGESWLSEADLGALSREKLDIIECVASLFRDSNA